MSKNVKKQSIELKDLFNSFLQIVIHIIIFILILYFLPKLIVFFMPLLFGFFISLISNRLVTALYERFHISRQKSSLAIVILVSIIFFALLFLLGMFLYSKIVNSVSDIKLIISDLNDLSKRIEIIINAFVESLPFENGRKITLPTFTTNNLINLVNNFSKPITNFSINLLKNIPVFLANIIFAILSAYIMIIDNTKLRLIAKNHISKKIYEYYKFLKKQSIYIFNSWFKTQLIVIILVFITLAIGFYVIKVRYFALLAFIIAIVDALPIFGSGLFLWPWMLLDILQGKIFDFIVIVLVYLIIQVIRNIVQNKIMSAELGLNSFTSIIILYLGFKFYGFVGLVFAIPVGIFVVSLYNFGAFDFFIMSLKNFYYLLRKYLQQNFVRKKK